MTPDSARALLDVWFEGASGPSIDPQGPVAMRWFARNEAFDSALRERFAGDLEKASRGELGFWCASPEGTLALIVLCDQIPRNIFRGSARAFATDAIALHTTLLGIVRGDHAALTIPERLFFLMPLMHSESLDIHDVAVREFESAVVDAEQRATGHVAWARNALDYEQKHRVIIERWGRYPHRNAALGRSSSAEEIAFLQQPGSSF
jgi:uncharacterized protein (DUF924 family)